VVYRVKSKFYSFLYKKESLLSMLFTRSVVTQYNLITKRIRKDFKKYKKLRVT